MSSNRLLLNFLINKILFCPPCNVAKENNTENTKKKTM